MAGSKSLRKTIKGPLLQSTISSIYLYGWKLAKNAEKMFQRTIDVIFFPQGKKQTLLYLEEITIIFQAIMEYTAQIKNILPHFNEVYLKL